MIRLQALSGAGAVPDIVPTTVPEFWHSLPLGHTLQARVRPGPWGLWWQYDHAPWRDRIAAFYEARDRAAAAGR